MGGAGAASAASVCPPVVPHPPGDLLPVRNPFDFLNHKADSPTVRGLVADVGVPARVNGQ